MLRGLSRQELGPDFDERFWKRFKAETAPRSGFLWPALGAAAVSAALFLAAAPIFVERPSLEIVQGHALIQTEPNAAVQPARLKNLLNKGNRIQTDQESWVILEFQDGYQIKLNPGSELWVKDLKSRLLPGKTVFYLNRGQTLVSIGGPGHRRYPMEIVTPNAFARAMGTQFLVSAPTPQNQDSKISVLNGVVRVGRRVSRQTQENTLSVDAGREAQVSEECKDLRVWQIAERSMRELEELFQFSRQNQAILLIGMGPNRFRELLRPCAIYLRIQSKDESVSSLAEIAREIQDAVESGDKKKHLNSVERLEEAIEKQNELSHVPILLFTGAYYAYLDRYPDAARIFGYVSLQYPDSEYASLALMAEASILRQKLNDPGKAEALLKEILTRYPNSPESESLLSEKF